MKKIRVAILGVGSIGKFHAREFHNAGCDVVAILGRTKESAEMKAKILKEEFSINAKPYYDLDLLLKSEKLDAVSICTPPSLHSSQVRECLEFGCNVICEKPFVLDTKHDNAPIAKELIELSRKKNLILTINTQWPSVIPELKKHFDLSNIKNFSMFMEPPIKGTINLISEAIPHVNSMIIALLPESEISDISSPLVTNEEVRIKFRYGLCDVECHFKLKEQRPRNLSFSINGIEFKRNTKFLKGDYIQQQLVYNERSIDIEDPLKISINKFISAIKYGKKPLILPQQLLKNVQLQDEIVKFLA